MEQRQALRVYASTLEGLEKLALRDWLAWWDQTKNTPFVERRALLEEPFAAIVATYGEQAAYAAADYMFLQRGLDETLAGLAYPEVADPVGYEQAAASLGRDFEASNLGTWRGSEFKTWGYLSTSTKALEDEFGP